MKNEIKKKKSERKWQCFSIILFFCFIAAGCILGFCFPDLRPEKSELEKRELTRFPVFNIGGFLEGDYTSDLSLWYSDTYPFRETLITANNTIELAYGIRDDSISNTGNGDEIPDLPAVVSSEAADSTDESSGLKESTAAGSNPAESSPSDKDSSAAESTEESTTMNGQEIVQMNPQEAGQVNVLNNIGYAVYGFNLSAADTYAENVANVADSLQGVSNVYEMLIPDNSAIMLDDATKAAWKLSDEAKVIAYYEAKIKSLTDNAESIEIYDSLMAHNSEYLYFHTDHHWTQLGAYYAYRSWAEALGETPHELSEYQQVVTTNFLGSYYTTNKYTQLQSNPDTITAYVPLTTNEISFFDDTLKTMRQGSIIRDMNAFSDSMKYLGFIYGDNSYSEINNPTVKNGKTCIVIKESFGNAFVPFIADHYEKVIIIDYRSYKDSVVQLARDENAQDILFINNLEAISSKYIMDVLGNICQ